MSTRALAVKEHRAYAALVNESRRVGLPVAFKRDLFVHDRRWVKQRDPSLPFVWALRSTGTHVFDPFSIHANGHDVIRWIEAVRDGFDEPTLRFYLWDGVGLHAFVNFEACKAKVSEMIEIAREQARVDAEISEARIAGAGLDNGGAP